MAALVFLSSVAFGNPFKDFVKDLTSNGSGAGLDEKTIIAGLKEALEIGTKKAVSRVSKKNGYFKTPEIKIPLPPELKSVGEKLILIGFKKKVNEFVESMNRAAEKAAPEAVDIFVDSVKQMTIKKAVDILRGEDDSATRYFEETTRLRLYSIFYPIIKRAMDKVGVTRIYKFLIGKYNSIPFVKKKSCDIEKYVTNKALDGLFYMIAREEKKIRKDPAARITDLLKKVFS